jgi:hypothetical protein
MFYKLLFFKAAQARQSQPPKKATPPNGVIAPSQRVSVKLSK